MASIVSPKNCAFYLEPWTLTATSPTFQNKFSYLYFVLKHSHWQRWQYLLSLPYVNSLTLNCFSKAKWSHVGRVASRDYNMFFYVAVIFQTVYHLHLSSTPHIRSNSWVTAQETQVWGMTWVTNTGVGVIGITRQLTLELRFF